MFTIVFFNSISIYHHGLHSYLTSQIPSTMTPLMSECPLLTLPCSVCLVFPLHEDTRGISVTMYHVIMDTFFELKFDTIHTHPIESKIF